MSGACSPSTNDTVCATDAPSSVRLVCTPPGAAESDGVVQVLLQKPVFAGGASGRQVIVDAAEAGSANAWPRTSASAVVPSASTREGRRMPLPFLRAPRVRRAARALWDERSRAFEVTRGQPELCP